MWDMIVSVSDHCLSFYFGERDFCFTKLLIFSTVSF